MSERAAALLDELAGTWEVMAEMETGSSQGRRETLRECADGLHMLADLLRKAENVEPQLNSQRAAEMEALLQSAGAIARRHGEGTAWGRFSESLRAIGINGITARTYRALPSDDEAATTKEVSDA